MNYLCDYIKSTFWGTGFNPQHVIPSCSVDHILNPLFLLSQVEFLEVGLVIISIFLCVMEAGFAFTSMAQKNQPDATFFP